MNKPSPVPLEFTEQHYAALGKMLVAFQSLESTVAQGLLRLLQSEKLVPDSALTMAIVGELSFASRLKLLLLYPSLNPVSRFVVPGEDLAIIKELEYCEAVELLNHGGRIAAEAEEKRNQLVHSQWLWRPIAGPAGTVLRYKSRVKKGKLHLSQEFVTASDIQAVAEAMAEAQSRLREAVDCFHFLVQSLSPEP